jgi:SAM-dependent methyltransferase
MSVETAEKYDRIADDFAERSWANLEFDMQHRLKVSTAWGPRLHTDDSVLELGCGDGYLAQLLIQQRLNYQGLDISPRMVAVARERISSAGGRGRFGVGDAAQLIINEPVDGVISYMGAFFTFVDEPLPLLHRLRPFIRKKIILDLNPRGKMSLDRAIAIFRQAGFVNIAWRPFFIPMSVKLPRPLLQAMCVCEKVPGLRALPLRWRFDVLLKGETAGCALVRRKLAGRPKYFL